MEASEMLEVVVNGAAHALVDLLNANYPRTHMNAHIKSLKKSRFVKMQESAIYEEYVRLLKALNWRSNDVLIKRDLLARLDEFKKD